MYKRLVILDITLVNISLVNDAKEFCSLNLELVFLITLADITLVNISFVNDEKKSVRLIWNFYF